MPPIMPFETKNRGLPIHTLVDQHRSKTTKNLNKYQRNQIQMLMRMNVPYASKCTISRTRRFTCNVCITTI
ncbi:hypothetical protein LINPERHAP2_LOCUS10059 [Linum perenne]